MALALHSTLSAGRLAQGRRVLIQRLLAASIWLLVAVVHTPTNAQAVVYSFFPDFLTLGTHEAATLFLTGLALLSLPALRRRRR